MSERRRVGPGLRRALIGWIGLVAMAVVWVGSPQGAAAHTPHDDIFDVALSPAFAVDRTALVISRAWVLRSTDGGVTWERTVRGLTLRSQPRRVEFSARDPKVAFLTTDADGVLRSADGGRSWSPTNRGLDGSDVALVATSPTGRGVVLAATEAGRLYRSADAGVSWSRVPGVDWGSTAIAFDPSRPGVVAAGDPTGGLHRSADDGATWTSSSGPGPSPVTALAFAPSERGRTLLVGTDGSGAYRSTNGGTAFQPLRGGLTDKAVRAFAVWPSGGTRATIWLSGGPDGVFVSDDGGTTWSRSSRGLTTDDQVEEEEYADAGRTDFGSLRVAEGPTGRPVLLLGGFDGLFRSTDGATSWEHVDTLRPGIVVGLDVVPRPGDTPVVAVTTYINGVHLSTDGGESWTSAGEDFGEPNVYRSRPDHFARLYSIGLSPDFARDRTMFTSTAAHFLRTTDGGRTWTRIRPPGKDEGRNVFVVAVSPNFAADGTVFYGDAVSGELFASTDRGRTFSRRDPVGSALRAIVIPRTFARTGTIFTAGGSGVQRSRDRGRTWTSVGGPRELVVGLSVSAAAPGRETILAATTTDLWGSYDGGTTWQAITPEGTGPDAFVEGLAMSPAFDEDGTALISLRGLGLFRSTDGGHRFTPVAAGLLAADEILGNYAKPTASAIVFSPDYRRDRTVYGFNDTSVLRSTDGASTWDVLDVPVSTHRASAGKTGPAPAARAEDRWTVALAAAGVIATAAGVFALLRRHRSGTATDRS